MWRTVLRPGGATEHPPELDALLSRTASDRDLVGACQLPLAECLAGHHAACVLLGDGFEAFPCAAIVASAVDELMEGAQLDCILRPF